MSKKQESCIGSLSSTILELQNIKPSCKILRFWCWDILSLPSATRQNASCKEVCLQLAASILHVLHPGNVDEIRVKQLATKRKSITAWIAVGRIIAATTLRWSAAWRRGAFCTVSSTNGISWVRRVWPAMPGKATRERPFFHKTEFSQFENLQLSQMIILKLCHEISQLVSCLWKRNHSTIWLRTLRAKCWAQRYFGKLE